MKTANIKEKDAQEIIRHKDIVCTSKEHVKWAKNYFHRSRRRNMKQIVKKEKENYETNKSTIVD